MAEYIEREAAKRAIIEAVDSGLAVTSDDLAEILDDLPAADVAPVRHGRWRRQDGYTECTECDYWYDSPENEDAGDRTRYCPNCGARMDGEEEK